MKKFLLASIITALFFVVAFASSVNYDFSLTGGQSNSPNTDYVTLTAANGTTVNYTQQLKDQTVDYLSYQFIGSTSTYSVTVATLTAINSVTNTIASTAAYPTGFALLYTSSSYNGGTALTNNTTYYAFNPTATTMQISTGTTGAIAVIPGTGTVGSFTLTPINVQTSSPFYLQWQSSNDGKNYYTMSASSVTILGSTGWSSVLWDFGFTDYKYIRAMITTGSFGAIKFNIRGYGKRVAP